eukprot:TRINITY_DN31390_c0_g1_i2.p2 TRINITY_DN31390_c0_g1~~TRINITY_DN31390_c0_g1_i2.p2  ORF type:complete len:164 (+),score=18.60 TRINITY_DN31390_c0_g1_i2:135-626(+)
MEAQQPFFQGASHPTACLFHVVFKIAAVLLYFFKSIFFSSSAFVMPFVIIVVILSCDFWVVKNITGRLLVGLRWWSELNDEGESTWKYAHNQEYSVGAIDSNVFWGGIIANVGIWSLFMLAALPSFQLGWAVLICVALGMSGFNGLQYFRCKRDAKVCFLYLC